MAVFALTLKQSIYCPRCLVCLYVIQFTRYRVVRSLAAENSFSLPSIARFVKSFFLFFSSFFEVSAPSRRFTRRSSESLHILPPSAPFVKHFLQFSSIFFGDFFRRTFVRQGQNSAAGTPPAMDFKAVSVSIITGANGNIHNILFRF